MSFCVDCTKTDITLADKSTVSWVDFGCKKLILLYAVIAAVAALCAATGGVALIAICALAGAAGAMWGAVVGSLLCGQLAAMARVWCSSKDDFQILGINTITGKDTMQCLAFTFIPDSAIEPIIMNFIQAFSPANKVRISIHHPCGMGLK